jgi:hypothetical protein
MHPLASISIRISGGINPLTWAIEFASRMTRDSNPQLVPTPFLWRYPFVPFGRFLAGNFAFFAATRCNWQPPPESANKNSLQTSPLPNASNHL